MSFIRFYYFGSWSRDGYCGFWRDKRQHSSLYFGFWWINLEWRSCSCTLSSYGKLLGNRRRGYLHSQYVASSNEGSVNDVIWRQWWRHYDITMTLSLTSSCVFIADWGWNRSKFFIVSGGGTLMGISLGFVGSYIFKITSNYPVIEPMFIFCTCYISYLLAELVGKFHGPWFMRNNRFIPDFSSMI